MRFGDTIRELRSAKGLTLRALGEKVGVSFAYISKVENGKLDFGDFPSADLIRKLAAASAATRKNCSFWPRRFPNRFADASSSGPTPSARSPDWMTSDSTGCWRTSTESEPGIGRRHPYRNRWDDAKRRPAYGTGAA